MSGAAPETQYTDKVFEIGLVMAGAISAGAYTAGVADFLIEALDQWYAENKPKRNSPHEVKIRVISGASAGGITGSILAAAFGGEFKPVRERPDQLSDNPLYRAWVQRIGIERLLETADIKRMRERGELGKQGQIRKLRKLRAQGKLSAEAFEQQMEAVETDAIISLFDSTVLTEIAAESVTVSPKAGKLMERRPYLPDPFQLYLSISNLRGVSYIMPFDGGDGTQRMVTHADFMHFALTETVPADKTHVSWADPSDPNIKFSYAYWLNPSDYTQNQNWKRLAHSALATSAFPFGLAPLDLSRSWDHYKFRTFPVSKYEDGKYIQVFQPLEPEYSSGSDEYQFVCVDGGLIDNAPFDLAHRALIEGVGSRTERDPGLSDRAIVLIAPFPDSKKMAAYKRPSGILAIAQAILGSLMDQVRFNPDELILASDPNVGSRFLISPRRLPARPGVQSSIACGSLEGFGGFLSEDFRHHDFMLGRRNCQRYLQAHFILPESNPLFKNWDASLKQRYYVDPPKGAKRTEKYLPIIPLTGTAREEVKLPDWPEYTSAQLEELVSHIGRRYESLGAFAADFYGESWWARRFLKLGLRSQKRRVLRLVKHAIGNALNADGINCEVKPDPSRAWLWWLLAALSAAGGGAVLWHLLAR